ncbi:MAG: prepilin-type N-terminal cleavage/methylation domain-containing protein [Dehalococcoidia bacterium]|nr:prepilin-type N-terminal cleavage/methylation domain-containing protein [Dehalococcoidia bacterium]
MKTKTKSRKGFTLIELMVAIVASAIVVLAAGIVIVIGQTSWNQTWKKVNLQRDASYAMLRMSQSIKAATSAGKSPDGRVLYIPTQSNPNITFSYVADTNNLQCQIVGEQPQTIINGEVKDLQFNVVGNNTVTIDLSLKKDDAQAHFKSTVMMRNCGG